MLNNRSGKWYLLWGMLALNLVLLIFAIINDGLWYMLSSLLWSLIILRYHAMITRIKGVKRLKKTYRENSFKRRAGLPGKKKTTEKQL